MPPDFDSPTVQDNSPELLQPTAIESIERAAVDIQITTAKKYPRNILAVRKAMMDMATIDAETSSNAFYTLRRKNKDGTFKTIQGPSVRMSEIAMSCYGNMQAGVRIVGNDGKVITAQGVCFDMEKNIRIIMEIQVRITYKNGDTYSQDMQTIAAARAGAIALRNSIFKVIPLAFIKPVYDKCKQIATGDAKSLGDRIEACVQAFAKMSVSEDQVLKYLGHESRTQVTLDDIELLLGTHSAIKNDETTIDETFKPGEAPKPKMDSPPAGPEKRPVAKPKTTRRGAAEPIVATTPAPAVTPTVTQAPGVTQPSQTTEPTNVVNMHEKIEPTVTQAPAVVPATTVTGSVNSPVEPPLAPIHQEHLHPDQSPPPAHDSEAPTSPTADDGAEVDPLAVLKANMERDGITEDQVMAYCKQMMIAKKTQNTLAQLARFKLETLAEGWDKVVASIQQS